MSADEAVHVQSYWYSSGIFCRINRSNPYRRFADTLKELFVELTWYGPFVLRNGKLAPHPVEPISLKPRGPGLYVVTGDHPIYGREGLLYIGETCSFTERFDAHSKIWLEEEWRIAVYITKVQCKELRENLEKLLIYAHSPPYNGKYMSDRPPISQLLRVWNANRVKISVTLVDN
jgi:hypothetical protein